VLAVTLSSGISAATARANCREASASEECLGCAHEIVELKDARSGTMVQGTVYRENSSDPFEGVLVEVFTTSDGKAPVWRADGTVQRTRVAACAVRKDGKFSLQLKPGNYWIRFSKDDGWNCTYEKIEVIEDFRAKKLHIPITIGT
jgi:hypothetical protein